MNPSSTVLVGTWGLHSTSESPADEAFLLDGHFDAAGSETSPDVRTLVDPIHLMPTGKYGAIVKLQIRYYGQAEDDNRWAQATGWLVTDDIVVTAGHCVFDWSHGFREAVSIKAYTGYNGKESTKQSTVQFRRGFCVATTRSWLTGAANRDGDVAFIRVKEPFRGITPFKLEATPMQAPDLAIGIVGYAADLRLGKERGARMYEQFDSTSFDLATSAKHMLEYRFSTFAGQSGSPVLIQDKNVSIGVHVYGFNKVNYASTINDVGGNPFSAYIKAFDDPKLNTSSSLLKYIEIPLREDSLKMFSGNDDFWQILGKTSQIGGTAGAGVLEAGTPFLGPSGHRVAAAAGTLLNFASQMALSSTEAESTLDVYYDIYGPMSRAVMAEAALQTVLGMHDGQLSNYKILEHMRTWYNSQKKSITSIAAEVMPAVMDSALRITMYTAHKDKTATVDPGRFEYPPLGSRSTRGVHQLTPNEEDFVTQITQNADYKDDESGLRTFLGSIVKTALSLENSPLENLVRAGKRPSNGKSDFVDKALVNLDLETLTQRAVLAEAALQALTKNPAAAMQEEGFLASITAIVTELTPVIIQVAPSIMGAVAPVVQKILESNPQSVFGQAQAGHKNKRDPVKEGDKGLPLPAKPDKPRGTTLADRLANHVTIKVGEVAEKEPSKIIAVG